MNDSVHNKKHYNYLCRKIQKQSKVDKDTFLRNICIEIEKAHVQKKTKEIYANVRKITGKQAPRVRVIKDKHGVVLTDQDQVRKRWGNISVIFTIQLQTLIRLCLQKFQYEDVMKRYLQPL